MDVETGGGSTGISGSFTSMVGSGYGDKAMDAWMIRNRGRVRIRNQSMNAIKKLGRGTTQKSRQNQTMKNVS